MERENIKPGADRNEVRGHKYHIAKLETKQEKVAYLMDVFPESRMNNNYLCVLFWRYAEGARSLDDITDITRMTSADSIIRNRQIVEKKRREGKTE